MVTFRQNRTDGAILGDLRRSMKVRSRVSQIGREVLAEQRASCPVRTGRLLASGYVSAPDVNGTVTVGFSAPYAGYAAYGTRYAHGDDFFVRPLLRRHATARLDRGLA